MSVENVCGKCFRLKGATKTWNRKQYLIGDWILFQGGIAKVIKQMI